jgi:uncharacterized membrane-anchored protein YitT (DUF2179 family)
VTTSAPDTRPARPTPQHLIAHVGKHPVAAEAYKIVSIMVGAIIFAIGLEGFLIPNGFLDGGVVGVSILLTEFVSLPMGVFIGLLNIPFVLLAWAMIGHRSAVRSGVGIATLSAATIYLHHMHPFTEQSWLALVCGGAMIAVGIGIALRHGGALDGTEVLATILASRTQYTVGQLILYINLCVFTVAGLVLGWEAALLSAVLFYVVVKDLVDQIAHGEHGARRARVTTTQHEPVARMIASRINRPVLVDEHTHWYADGPGEKVWVVTFACSRMEEATLVEDIEEIDPEANVTFSEITNLHGPMYESMTNKGH